MNINSIFFLLGYDASPINVFEDPFSELRFKYHHFHGGKFLCLRSSFYHFTDYQINLHRWNQSPQITKSILTDQIYLHRLSNQSPQIKSIFTDQIYLHRSNQSSQIKSIFTDQINIDRSNQSWQIESIFTDRMSLHWPNKTLKIPNQS